MKVRCAALLDKERTFGGDEDEEEGYDSDNSEDKSASLFNTEKFTLKQSGIRAYIAFRL